MKENILNSWVIFWFIATFLVLIMCFTTNCANTYDICNPPLYPTQPDSTMVR